MFLLDHVLFGGFRKQKITTPLFIIGNFRSGTTFLYRLLAKDTRNFTCFKTWEIYVAPSIAQRKLFRGILLVDKVFGGLITRIVHKIEKNMLSQVKLHSMGLTMPEEDEGILLYIWNSLWIWFFFPVFAELDRYFQFDEKMPVRQKKAIMTFYRKCVQRHIYAHGGRKIFLSKNPSFTPRIASLLEYFPDAKIINMIRNPLEMVPSNLNWFSVCWSWFNDLKTRYPFKNEVMAMCRHWYLYPIKRLAGEEKTRHRTISYEEMTGAPEQVVKDFYGQFGFRLHAEFARLLQSEAQRAKTYNQNKAKSPPENSLMHKEILEEFVEVLSRFGYGGSVK